MKCPPIWLRRTSHTPLLGRLGLSLFFAVFFSGGVLGLWQMTIRPAVRWLEARQWTPVTATMESSRLSTSRGTKGAVVHGIEVRYSWKWLGRTYQGTQHGLRDGKTNIAVPRIRAEVERLAAAETVQCWVDPANPAVAVIDRSMPGQSLTGIFFSLPFLTAGGLGVGWCLFGPWLIRRRRRQCIDGLDRMRNNGWLTWTPPLDPEAARNSDKVRLIFARQERLLMAGLGTAINLFWNGIVSVFVLTAIAEILSGAGWGVALLVLFLIPFIVIGAFMAWVTVNAWRNTLRPGWVAVVHPLPGHQPVGCRITFAPWPEGRLAPWNFQRIRLVAMAGQWIGDGETANRAPTALYRPRQRPRVLHPAETTKKEHELTSVEVPLPSPGQPVLVKVPAMPEVKGGGKRRWSRWWDLEIEHGDGRIETFEIAVD